MKLYTVFLCLFLLTGVYLNRTYAYYFDTIGYHRLPDPNSQLVYVLGESDNQQKPFAYVALGDSLTAGVGASDYTKTYGYSLTQSLHKKYRYVAFTDLGQPGAKSRDVLDNQVTRAIADSPDLITVLVGTNDVLNHVDLKVFEKNLIEIVYPLIHKTHAKVIMMNIPYLGSNSLVYPPYNMLLDWRVGQYNQVIEKVAQKYSLELVDLYTPSKKAFAADQSMYSVDQFHPSDKGYILWGHILSDAISNQ
jgi:lysophospholipase L1-like esterase